MCSFWGLWVILYNDGSHLPFEGMSPGNPGLSWWTQLSGSWCWLWWIGQLWKEFNTSGFSIEISVEICIVKKFTLNRWKVVPIGFLVNDFGTKLHGLRTKDNLAKFFAIISSLVRTELHQTSVYKIYQIIFKVSYISEQFILKIIFKKLLCRLP